MNPSTPSDRLWRKRLNELSSVWPEFLGGHTTGLHKTRVASRRIREALPIVGVCAPPEKVKKLHRKMRKLTRYLGPIRELDVKLDMLEAASRHPAISARALELVRREVASQRQALRQRLGESAPVSDLRKLVRKLERIADMNGAGPRKLEKFEAQWRSALAARLLRRAKDLGRTLEAAGPIYAPSRVHEVRIAIKKLRYALEIAQDARVAASTALVRVLKRHQERLGRLNDFQALLRHVRETEALPGVGSQVNELAAYAEALERDCRRLHAEFVERRQDLMDLVKDVRLQIVPALTAPRRRQASVRAVRRPALPDVRTK
jgi:CHAD domain-containing protein